MMSVISADSFSPSYNDLFRPPGSVDREEHKRPIGIVLEGSISFIGANKLPEQPGSGRSLTGTNSSVFMNNGAVYTVQDLAFFSWFARQGSLDCGERMVFDPERLTNLFRTLSMNAW